MGEDVSKNIQRLSAVEMMQIFNSGVYISPTTRCNARCRHCIAQDDEPEMLDVKEEDLMKWVDEIHACGMKTIHFVGGEPFLVQKTLVNVIKHMGELEMFAGVVTNGSWAKTKEVGISILNEMPDLNFMIISCDKYHLEYIDIELVKNAIEAGLATNKFIVINTTYIGKDDIDHIQSLLKEYKNKIMFQTVKAMPFHGEESKKITKYEYFQMPTRVSKFCGIGNYFIDCYGTVYTCCQASRSLNTRYLELGNLNEESLVTMDQRMKSKPVFQFIQKNGPRGILKIFMDSPWKEELEHNTYACSCELCHELLDRPELYAYFVSQIEGKGSVNES